MRIDRRIIFVLIAFSVAIPLIFKIGLPNRVTKEVRMVYDAIDELEREEVVLVSFDHEASSLPEIKPMADAILRHCFSKDLKVISFALLAEGTAIGDQILRDIAAEYEKRYGEDYVYLGFRPQYTAAILGLGEDLHRVFPEDYRGISTSELPLTKKIKNYNDISLVISIADGDLPSYWINYAEARYHQRLAIAVTAVMATTYYPYLSSGQIKGLVGGLKGAAEYEILIGKPGMGGKGMDAQSIAHLVILLLVAWGNVSYFLGRRNNSKGTG